jgi:hypothetical protein
MADFANRQNFLLDKKFFPAFSIGFVGPSNKSLMHNTYNPCAGNKLMHNEQVLPKILAQELLG